MNKHGEIIELAGNEIVAMGFVDIHADDVEELRGMNRKARRAYYAEMRRSRNRNRSMDAARKKTEDRVMKQIAKTKKGGANG